MATVIGKTSERIDALLSNLIVGVEIVDDRLIVTTRGGFVLDAGPVGGGGGASSADLVSYDGSTSLSSTNVEAALDELDTEKAPVVHTHDDRYFTETETTTLLAGKSDTSHNHDSRYYTETEVDTLLTGKSDTSHNHDARYYTESEVDALIANFLSLNNLPYKKAKVSATVNQSTMSGNITLDGYTTVDGDRVLLTAQTTSANNGLWVTGPGAWVRAPEADTPEKFSGMIVIVEKGSGDGSKVWHTTFNGHASSMSASKPFYRVMDTNMSVLFAQLPTGTTSTTVALGNHGHALTDSGITGTLPLSKGGTNATTASAARTSLVAAGFNTSTNPAMSAGVWSSSINHNLNSLYPDVSFNLVTGGESIDMHWKVIDANNIQIRADVAVTAGDVRVLVTAGV